MLYDISAIQCWHHEMDKEAVATDWNYFRNHLGDSVERETMPSPNLPM
jgi:hypothetical protein